MTHDLCAAHKLQSYRLGKQSYYVKAKQRLHFINRGSELILKNKYLFHIFYYEVLNMINWQEPSKIFIKTSMK